MPLPTKKILITGGSGTIGSVFIEKFYHHYQFVSFSKNDEKQLALKKKFPRVALLSGSIEDSEFLLNVFKTEKPDIVIHAAALKRVEIAENEPSKAIQTNLLGAMNVIDASTQAEVPVTIGISSDKSCSRKNVYGQTKYLMERLFLKANKNHNMRFSCCRLSNVACSEGSVIPIWLTLAKKKLPLRITDAGMNRFMLSKHEVAHLIQETINASYQTQAGIFLKKTKAINLLALAKEISDEIEIIGKRPGEELNETLVSQEEVSFSYQEQDYILIKSIENPNKENRLLSEVNTMNVDTMNQSELKIFLAGCASL